MQNYQLRFFKNFHQILKSHVLRFHSEMLLNEIFKKKGKERLKIERLSNGEVNE